MENTLENKAKFFALYPQGIKETDFSGMYSINVFSEEYHILELYNLTRLHPSDAMIVGKIVQPLLSLPKVTEHHGKIFVKRLLGNEYGNKQDNLYRIEKTIQAIDYLRSRGYALPWMGLSVEKLIEYGWIKLKED